MNLTSIAAIKAASESEVSVCPFWFRASSMEFFNTRVLPEVHLMGRHGALFVTADRPDLKSPEGFCVRWAHMKDGSFYITTLGNIMDYESEEDAKAAMEILGDALGDIVRATENE